MSECDFKNAGQRVVAMWSRFPDSLTTQVWMVKIGKNRELMAVFTLKSCFGVSAFWDSVFDGRALRRLL